MRCGSCKIVFEQTGFVFCPYCSLKLEKSYKTPLEKLWDNPTDEETWKDYYHIPGYMFWDDEQPDTLEVKFPYIGDFPPRRYPWTAPPVYPNPWFGVIQPLPFGVYLGTRTRAKTDSNP